MSLYRAKTIKRMWESEQVFHPQLKEWIPTRPMNYKFDKIKDRMKWARGVLVGRYDAVDWQDDMEAPKKNNPQYNRRKDDRRKKR